MNAFRRPADATFLIGALGAVMSGYVLHRLFTAESLGFTRRDAVWAGGLILAFAGAALVVAGQQDRLVEAFRPITFAALWFGAALAVVFGLRHLRAGVGPVVAAMLVTGVVAADLGVNNGPNESTALAPEVL